MKTLNLSAEAADLLCRRLVRERVKTTDETRPLYRELVQAGLMIPLHTFLGGNESAYRLTDAACDVRGEINGLSSRIPSPGGSPSPGS